MSARIPDRQTEMSAGWKEIEIVSPDRLGRPAVAEDIETVASGRIASKEPLLDTGGEVDVLPQLFGFRQGPPACRSALAFTPLTLARRLQHIRCSGVRFGRC